MRLLLTGASGFVGRNFLCEAVKKNWEIIALYNSDQRFPEFINGFEQNKNIIPVKCNLLDTKDIDSLVNKFGATYDLCLYLAARVDIPGSVKEPGYDLACNTLSLLNLLEKTSFGKFVYMSSGAVYDGLKGEVSPGILIAPTLPYSISRYATELYVQFFHERRELIDKYVILRFYGAYGPYEPTHKIFTKLLDVLYFQNKNEFEIYGDGKNLINAMYIEDAVNALIRVIENEKCNLTVDLTATDPISIENLVKNVATILGKKEVEIIRKGISNEYIGFYSDSSEMKRLYGFTPVVSLTDGIMKFLEFQKKKQGK